MKIVLDLNDTSTVRCVGVWIHMTFSVPLEELTADILSRLMAREDWQKAFWSHVTFKLWCEANEKSQVVRGRELPDKPDLKTWMESSLRRFESMYAALLAAGFTLPPMKEGDMDKAKAVLDLLSR